MSELWSETMPGLDCLSRGHVLVEMVQEGAFEVSEIPWLPWANWCLWCGGGVSNEYIPDGPDPS